MWSPKVDPGHVRNVEVLQLRLHLPDLRQRLETLGLNIGRVEILVDLWHPVVHDQSFLAPLSLHLIVVASSFLLLPPGSWLAIEMLSWFFETQAVRLLNEHMGHVGYRCILCVIVVL